MKHLKLTILLLLVFASHSFAIQPITSDSVFCVGLVGTFSDGTTGGKWHSSITSVATIDTGTGLFTGVSAGTTTITYTVGSSYVTKTVMVQPSPLPITGIKDICAGATTILSDSIMGGKWTSSDTMIASVDAASGLASGVAAGSATITYTEPGHCYDAIVMTVHTLGGSIDGWNLCVDAERTYTETEPGGTWTSAGTAIVILGTASAFSTSIYVKGVAVGQDTLKYTVTNACGAGTAVYPIYVHEKDSWWCWLGVANAGTGTKRADIYPNPATASITITSPDKITSITITNLLGQTVYDQQHNSGQVQVDIMDLPAGTYLVRINGTEVRKFVKQK